MNKIRPSLLCLAILILGALPANADEPSRHTVWAAVLERFDLNKNQSIEVEELAVRLQEFAQQADADHNGKVSPEELQKAAAQIRQIAGDQLRTAAHKHRQDKVSIARVEERVHQALQKADVDHNGDLTRAEARQAIHAAVDTAGRHVAEHCKEHQAALTALIDRGRAEYGPMLTVVAEQIEKADPEKLVVEATIRTFDSNGDQLLQRDELQARGQQLFSLADADHDGALSDSELHKATLKAAEIVRKRVEERFAELIKLATAK